MFSSTVAESPQVGANTNVSEAWFSDNTLRSLECASMSLFPHAEFQLKSRKVGFELLVTLNGSRRDTCGQLP
jgi:hypothetical protein